MELMSSYRPQVLKYSPSQVFEILNRVQEVKQDAYEKNPKAVGKGQLFKSLFPTISSHSWDHSYFNLITDKGIRICSLHGSHRLKIFIPVDKTKPLIDLSDPDWAITPMIEDNLTKHVNAFLDVIKEQADKYLEIKQATYEQSAIDFISSL